MKLLLIVCVLALAATPGQAQSPGSFRVLDKINGILEKELNVLNGDSSQMSSQVALRGNSMNFMKVGETFVDFKAAAVAKYNSLKKDAIGMKDDASKKFDGGMVWAKGKLDAHPYRWMAFKVGVTIVTTIICPACTFALGALFFAIDSLSKFKDLRVATAGELPEGLTDEAKAACKADLFATTAPMLLMIAAGAVNVFVPIPLDVAGAAGAGVAEVFNQVDFSALLDSGVADSAKGTLAAMGDFMKKVIGGAVGEKADGKANEMLKKIKDWKGKDGKGKAVMGKIDCTRVIAAPDEVSTGDATDKDTQQVSFGL